MKNNKLLLFLEFLILFVLVPSSLLISFSVRLKILLVIVAFLYLLFKMARTQEINFHIKKDIGWNSFFRRLLVTFILVAITTTAYVWIQDKAALFFVPRSNLKLFIVILFVYTFLSAWPQELIYRTFFFERYKTLFQNKTLFIFVNAIVFSLAHVFFRNTLVLILTFVGGIIFGYTYLKYRSTTAVTIEHALYGNWLFTVGMGQMLAFPGME